VRKGESLYSIAQANGLSVARLKSINSLSNNKIVVGQLLKLE
jgi:LysM repeat protein